MPFWFGRPNRALPCRAHNGGSRHLHQCDRSSPHPAPHDFVWRGGQFFHCSTCDSGPVGIDGAPAAAAHAEVRPLQGRSTVSCGAYFSAESLTWGLQRCMRLHLSYPQVLSASPQRHRHLGADIEGPKIAPCRNRPKSVYCTDTRSCTCSSN